VTITTATPVQTGQNPQTLVDPETFGKIARHFAALHHVTQSYAERATAQMLLMLKAHAAAHVDTEFGMLLPGGERYRVVPTEPVDAAWHAALQITEPYAEACQQIAGRFIHHRPIITGEMLDGTAIAYTLKALESTGYRVDPEFWNGEAESCCPPNPGV
jgi:hypothetical protein